jgi:hypothetical protein
VNADVAPPSADDKPAQRELLLSDLRLAAARAKLETQLFESIAIGVRQRHLTCAAAREQLRKEGLLDRLGGAR